MKNYDMLCQAILKEIGSKDNVSFVTHCMTRLRMNLKDEGLVDMETVKKIPEVLGCQFSGEQFQIIIGPEVSEVYPVFLKSAGILSGKWRIKLSAGKIYPRGLWMRL